MSEGRSPHPIIVKKVSKGEGGHHGGAWKLAYADYVTAMMAFFLLMWLLATASKEQKAGIADYFKDPWKPSLSGGASTGDRTRVIEGGGEDITRSAGHGKSGAEREDANRLNQLKSGLEELIQKDPVMQQFKDQLKVEITEEGLRVQIVDQEKRPMFELASARMEPYAGQILQAIAPLINGLPNKVSITGHTDARPFPGGDTGYSNWELSADRANAARKELVAGGLREDKVMRVVGLASSVPFNRADPLDPSNRRISIIVLSKKTEEAILGSGSAELPKSAPVKKPPAKPKGAR